MGVDIKTSTPASTRSTSSTQRAGASPGIRAASFPTPNSAGLLSDKTFSIEKSRGPTISAGRIRIYLFWFHVGLDESILDLDLSDKPSLLSSV